MKFKRLRLSGFKSFVDPVELYLQDGLTGIVGPNGCGKSNLVEALRWVMGENSAKAMRGGAMDDVIFAGSAGRSARNISEVTLLLDNSDRKAPAAFNDADELEISRRIERESGSTYRINGREARAKDVQILFADAATGSHSPSIVSQGRVGALINAKPRDRRSILESAAGISGLHARRHEAELRLRAAEENLVRLADVMGQIEIQLASLKRQARHALRYQKISAEIRSQDAILLYLRWSTAAAQLEDVGATLSEIERQVTALTRDAAVATTEQTNTSAKLPEIRQFEAEAAAKLHRMTTALDILDAEAERLAGQQIKLATQFEEVTRDIERETSLSTEANTRIEELDGELKALAADTDTEAAKLTAARAAVSQAAEATTQADEALQQLNANLARLKAEAEAQRRRISEAQAREERLHVRFNETDKALTRAREAAPDETAERTAQDRIVQAEKALLKVEASFEKASIDRAAAQNRSEELRDAFEDTKAALARLETEDATLSRLMAGHGNQDLPGILEAISVKGGFEAALGAALGEDLDAPLQSEDSLQSDNSADGAAVHWQTLPPLSDVPPLPKGITPLSDVVKAPATMTRRLSQIGIVADADGARLQSALTPGQRLVSKKGSLWRWDGFTARHGAPTVAAARLEQKNRLAAIAKEQAIATDLLQKAESKYEAARTKLKGTEAAEESSRNSLREAQREIGTARDAIDTAKSANADYHRRVELLIEAHGRFQAEWQEATVEYQALTTEDGDTTAIDELSASVDGARDDANNRRTSLRDVQTVLATATSESEIRLHRIASLTRERETWGARAINSHDHISRLQKRADTTAAEQAELDSKPKDMAERKAKAMAERDTAEMERRDAAAQLAEQEDLVSTANRALKEVQERLSLTRENRIRVQAQMEQTQAIQQQVAERIDEVLQCRPEQALQKAGIDTDEELPAVSQVEPRLERLKADRERMGPVNLRAEIEAEETETQLTTMQTERADLEEAIGRLRQAIGSLNREGRERLLTAFEQVNTHFTELFQQLFGGGQAHLALTESDDPLDAGLEIMASPPGKKLQIMSLLSGGEQALTALCLIFAVFQTNPSPICVLDEVDAPLDDANVERLCNLLDKITRETGTRFLIVTHHPLTMSRVNNLFGVTMPERGVSQLVSVDLDAGEGLRAVG